MKRVHEPYLNPSQLYTTLYELGVRGITPAGALAWQTYPIAADSAPMSAPAGLPDTYGSSVGFISPNLLSAPYAVTHLNLSFGGHASGTSGNRSCVVRLQDTLGASSRSVRFQNPAKVTSAVSFGESKVFPVFPWTLTSNLGVRGAIASEGIGGDDVQVKGYLTAKIVPRQIVPALLALAPTALGAVLPTTAANTALTTSGTAWTFGSYVQLTAGLGTGALITAVVISSQSVANAQVGLSTGAGGSEIDWGIFGWSDPLGTLLVGTRYELMPYPLFLPSGARLAAHARSADTSQTVNVGVEYIPVPLR